MAAEKTKLLGRGIGVVRQQIDADQGRVACFRRLGEAEAGQFRASDVPVRQDDGFGRKIAMDDAAAMHRREPLGEAVPQSEDLVGLQPAPGDHGGQWRPVDMLRHQVPPALLVAEQSFVADDRVVAHPGQFPGLLDQQLYRSRIAGERGGDQLEGVRRSQLDMLGAVDFAKLAGPKQFLDDVGMTDDGPGTQHPLRHSGARADDRLIAE